MKVSVAICTFNGAKYIIDQLQSIKEQTHVPDEIIICDDQSTDHTMDLINKYASETSLNIKFYRNEKNLGSTGNFEKAIRLCSGDFIFLSDQDDMWMRDKVKKILAYFNQHQDMQVVFTDGYVIDENGIRISTLYEKAKFDKEQQRLWTEGKAFSLLLKNGNYATGATMAIRKEFISRLLPFEKLEAWIHDGIIALKASIDNQIGFFDEKLIMYRQHSAQQVGFKKENSRVKETFLSLQRKIKGSWIHKDKHLERDIRDYRALQTIVERYDCNDCNTLIKEKLTHLEKRKYYRQQQFFKKLLPLSQEWLTRNYELFSCNKREKAWALLVKDLIGK